ncbi:MAG: phosphomannomutase/phosphoglucomutase [Gammaproteobacteria bacterium]
MVKKAKPEGAPDAATEKASTKAARPVKSAKPAGPGGIVRYAALGVLAGAAAIVVGTLLIRALVIDAGIDAERERLASTYARQHVALINRVLGNASQQLAGIAKAASTRDALTEANPARIAATAAAYGATLGGGAEVFLLTLADNLDSITLGYAAQGLADSARRGQPTRPEVIPIKQRPLLLMASPVKGEGEAVIGAVLVGFDLNELSANLKIFDTSAGYMELRQTFDDGESRTVLTYGQEPATTVNRLQEETLFPHLTVAYSLNPSAVSPPTQIALWIIAAVMILLAAVAVVASLLLADRAVRRNTSMLLQVAEGLLRRERTSAGTQFSLGVFAEAAASLTRIARELPAGGTATAGTAANNPARATAAIDILDMDADDAPVATATRAPATAGPDVADEIFRAYDIRGVVGKTLTVDTMRALGRAIGSEALDQGQQALYVGRDGRLSGPQMVEAFSQGVISTGCRVLDLGMAPTPVIYFAAANSAVKSCVVITGSHNPPDYNGLKIVIAGETLAEKRIQALKQRIRAGEFRTGTGSIEQIDFTGKYLERIRDDIVLARTMKIVVDCGNGVAGAVAPQLLSSIGCTIIPLYCDVDGHFPNHHPDPSKPENLKELIEAVAREGADLGLAFDGDGDRIGVVTPQGEVIFPDRLMMLYARDLLMRSPGADIIFDMKCTRDLASVISQNGGRPIMWRTGHSLIKAKLKETGAALAGEMSGHIFFNDRWPGFDDAMYAAARLLEILSLETESIDQVFAAFPKNISTPEINIAVPEQRKFAIIDALQQAGEFPGGNAITIDGVRVDYPDAWGLLRASNTTANLVARFEAKTDEELARVKDVFRAQLAKIEPSLEIPF